MSTSLRYELAYNCIWGGYSNWKKKVITNDPDSRQGKALSKEFGREVAILAESDSEIPIAKSNRKPIKKIKQQPSGVK